MLPRRSGSDCGGASDGAAGAAVAVAGPDVPAPASAAPALAPAPGGGGEDGQGGDDDDDDDEYEDEAEKGEEGTGAEEEEEEAPASSPSARSAPMTAGAACLPTLKVVTKTLRRGAAAPDPEWALGAGRARRVPLAPALEPTLTPVVRPRLLDRASLLSLSAGSHSGESSSSLARCERIERTSVLNCSRAAALAKMISSGLASGATSSRSFFLLTSLCTRMKLGTIGIVLRSSSPAASPSALLPLPLPLPLLLVPLPLPLLLVPLPLLLVPLPLPLALTAAAGPPSASSTVLAPPHNAELLRLSVRRAVSTTRKRRLRCRYLLTSSTSNATSGGSSIAAARCAARATPGPPCPGPPAGGNRGRALRGARDRRSAAHLLAQQQRAACAGGRLPKLQAAPSPPAGVAPDAAPCAAAPPPQRKAIPVARHGRVLSETIRDSVQRAPRCGAASRRRPPRSCLRSAAPAGRGAFHAIFPSCRARPASAASPPGPLLRAGLPARVVDTLTGEPITCNVSGSSLRSALLMVR